MSSYGIGHMGLPSGSRHGRGSPLRGGHRRGPFSGSGCGSFDPLPPGVDMEEDTPWKWMWKRNPPPPPQKSMWKRTPPRSGHGRGPPQKWMQKRTPPEVVVEEDQLRSTAGQAGGMP